MYLFQGERWFLEDVATSYGMAGGGVSCSGSLLEKLAMDGDVRIEKRMNITSNSIKATGKDAAMRSNLI